jgi:hypothetical protein
MAARQDSSVAEQLEGVVKSLQTDHADSKEHEIGQLVWMRWRYIDGDEPLDKMLAECEKFAERYPENRELATLFTLAAEKLVQDGRLNEARRCCEMAHSLLGEVPALEDMRTEVQTHQQEVQHVTRVNRTRSFEEEVLARLGGNYIGNFVLYSEDQNRQSRRRRRDFKVVYGARAAIAYARRAEQKGWQWDVVGVYPSTESGLQQARNHIATLRQNDS